MTGRSTVGFRPPQRGPPASPSTVHSNRGTPVRLEARSCSVRHRVSASPASDAPLDDALSGDSPAETASTAVESVPEPASAAPATDSALLPDPDPAAPAPAPAISWAELGTDPRIIEALNSVGIVAPF